jgi:hypothetical protein
MTTTRTYTTYNLSQTAMEAALLIVRTAIEAQRRGRGDWSDVRIRSECIGVEEAEGRAGFLWRVWARKGSEECEVVQLGSDIAVVRSRDEVLASRLPDPGYVAKYGVPVLSA